MQARFPASWRVHAFIHPHVPPSSLSCKTFLEMGIQLRLALGSPSVKQSQIQCRAGLKGENWAVSHNPWGKDSVVLVLYSAAGLLFLYGLCKLHCLWLPSLLFQIHLSKGRLFSVPHLRLLCLFLNHRHVGEGKRQMMGDRIFSILEGGTDRVWSFLSFSPRSKPSSGRSFSLMPWDSWSSVFMKFLD